MSVITAAAGSSAGPSRPERPTRPSAAGADTEPWRPRNSVRSAVTTGSDGPVARKAVCPAKLPAQAFRARTAPHSGSRSADHLQRGVLADGAEHPFGIIRRRQAARPVAVVSQREAHELDRVVGRHEHQQVLIQLMTDVGVAREALAMTDGDGRAWSARQGRGRPDLARLLVAQVDHLARRVRTRVVRPRGEAVHLAVARPGVAQAGLGHQASESRVGQHVGPGGRRQGRSTRGGAVDDDHVLAAIPGEPSEAVPEEQAFGLPGGLRRGLGRDRA